MNVEMANNTIPVRLREESFGFVKLRQKSKIPVESNWQNTNHSHKEAQTWLDEGFNYGILGGCGDLIIIDADCPELSQTIRDRLPATFTVRTPGGGHHYYFRCKEIKRKIVLKRDDLHFGEIISSGAQVVGPGSIHPDTGTEYQVMDDAEIAEVNREQILSKLV